MKNAMGRFKSHNRLLAALVLACRNATWNQKKKIQRPFLFLFHEFHVMQL